MASFSTFARAVRRGNWRFAWLLTENTLYGITHVTCRQCGKRKGFNTWSRCAKCQLSNLMKALEDAE